MTLFSANSTPVVPEKRREFPWINVLKLLCALMVVHIHVPVFYQPYILPLCTIAVPVFFIISGYFLTNNRGTFDFGHIRRSILKVIKIIAFALILYIAVSVLSAYRNGSSITEMFSNGHNWIEMVAFGSWPHEPLWYLTALLEAFAVILLISRFKSMEKMRDLTVVIVAALLMQSLICYLIIGPEVTDQNRYLTHTFLWPALPCLAIGSVIRRVKRLPGMKLVVASVIILTCAIYVLDSFREITGGLMHIQCQTVAVALAAMVFMVFLKMENASPFVWKVAALGRDHSRNIYIVHSLCMLIVINIFPILPESLLAVTVFVVSIMLSAGWNKMQRMKTCKSVPGLR